MEIAGLEADDGGEAAGVLQVGSAFADGDNLVVVFVEGK